MTYEGFRLKVNKFYRKSFSKYRNKKLKNKNFTIISNNCWGGMIYESYDLPKNSPTVGLFFMADDYIKFVSDLKKYTSSELTFINPNTSKHFNIIKNYRGFGEYPVGKIDDIEIMFLHYHSESEAYEKWKRRCQRINWNRLLVKFNDQNECSLHNVIDFIDLPIEHKIFFTIKDWDVKNEPYIYRVNQIFDKSEITASHELYRDSRRFPLTEIINNL